MEWDYEIQDQNGLTVAIVSKEVLRMTDTYVLDIGLPQDMLVCCDDGTCYRCREMFQKLEENQD